MRRKPTVPGGPSCRSAWMRRSASLPNPMARNERRHSQRQNPDAQKLAPMFCLRAAWIFAGDRPSVRALRAVDFRPCACQRKTNMECGAALSDLGRDLCGGRNDFLVFHSIADYLQLDSQLKRFWKSGRQRRINSSDLRQFFLDPFAQHVEEQFLTFLDARCHSARHQQIERRRAFGESAIATEEANAFDAFAFGLFEG